MQIVNQYSLLFVFLFAAGLALVVLWQRKARREYYLTVGLIFLAAGGAWFLARPQASAAGGAAAIRAQIGQGVPVLLEFQSAY